MAQITRRYIVRDVRDKGPFLGISMQLKRAADGGTVAENTEPDGNALKDDNVLRFDVADNATNKAIFALTKDVLVTYNGPAS